MSAFADFAVAGAVFIANPSTSVFWLNYFVKFLAELNPTDPLNLSHSYYGLVNVLTIHFDGNPFEMGTFLVVIIREKHPLVNLIAFGHALQAFWGLGKESE